MFHVKKCYVKENFAENNGRLICAKKVCLSITNIDFDVIENCYKWENLRIGNFYIYQKNYLPTEFVKCILQLYKQKTELKGVDGMEREYLNSKEMLNSCYGMSVTNPLRNEFIFSRETLYLWNEKKLTDSEKIKMLADYNLNENRFLFYLWGVFVTAYARKNLWSAIFNINYDYVYSDTDSIIYMGYGSVELPNHAPSSEALISVARLLLTRRVNVALKIIPGGAHNESSWEKQIPLFMDYLGL